MDNRLSKQITEWTETEKAFWILENGEPNFAWIFERNGDTVYRRPMAAPGTVLPPWISTEREDITDKVANRNKDKLYGQNYNEHND